MTLHEAIRQLLREVGTPMTTAEIAKEINTRGTYTKRDGSPVSAFQIHGRTKNYPHLFSRSGSSVSLNNAEVPRPTPSRTPRPALTNPSTTRPAGPASSPTTADDPEYWLADAAMFRPAGTIDGDVPDQPGLYAIRIHDVAALPQPFADLAAHRGHSLIYLGIARTSLRRRFLGQELRARGHGTFFRSIGALLGFRPITGSLIGKGNTRNYTFAHADEQAIIAWINDNLLVNWVETAHGHEAAERRLITRHLPLLNLQGNPAKLVELSALRRECVRIANTPA